MRRRQKFCDLAVYVPSEAMDVLVRGAELHGVAWYVAYEEMERRLKRAAEAAAVEIIREYAGSVDSGLLASAQDDISNGSDGMANGDG